MIRRLAIVVFSFAAAMMIGTFVVDAVAPMWEPLPYFFWTTIGALILANLLIPLLALRLAKSAEPQVEQLKKAKQRIFWGGALGSFISVLELTRIDSR